MAKTTFRKRNPRRGARKLPRKRKSKSLFSMKKAGSVMKTRNGQTAITYHPAKNHAPFADRFNTTFRAEFIGTSVGLAAGINYFIIGLDALYHPFNKAQLPNYTAFDGIDSIFSPSTGSAVTGLTPIGYSALVNVAAYEQWRVRKSQLKLTLTMPGNSGIADGSANPDMVTCVIIPTALPSTVSSLGGLHMADWLRQPFAKHLTIRDNGKTTCSSVKISPATIYGKPEQAFEYDISGTHDGTSIENPPSTCVWLCLLESKNGQAVLGNIAIEAELIQEVELFALSSVLSNSVA